ncbi:hypothetical protein IOD16_30180 [Saccharothrix sp. 6-C]|uniref:hypothetical protein n=1 Tax=Saccharothrix sp. 6-C TaxID=2781735 RepID=UPI00191710BC|nr:hypothetical protein [Saccharothrix sp. 6-C]QQQ75332.1 hypothetical protein IOD16_30180 [Saccharothrix sp. 6-C]
MGGVAVVVGSCALSFAAGCVLTAIMLRREQPPEPAAHPVPAAPAPLFEPRFPPEDYATRPIHRNPVMGFPTALPAPERLRSAPLPPRPNLVVVPDPVAEGGKSARPDEVRRMHVVRAEPEPQEGADPVDPLVTVDESIEPGAVPAEPVELVSVPAGSVEPAGSGGETAAVVVEPGGAEESGGAEEPGVVQVVARP